MKVTRDYMLKMIENEVKRNAIKKDQIFCLYIHNPFCARICKYCIYNGIQIDSNRDLYRYYYEEFLPRQLEAIRPLLLEFTPDQIYFGGGTASLMKPEYLDSIVSLIPSFDKIGFKTMEANPNDFSLPILDRVIRYQFDYVSFGVQSFDTVTLEMNNRMEITPEELAFKVARLQAAGVAVNTDLLTFITTKTPMDINILKQDLRILANQVDPARITVYPNYNVFQKAAEAEFINFSETLRNVLIEFSKDTHYFADEDSVSLNTTSILDDWVTDYVLVNKKYGNRAANKYNCTGTFSENNKNQITVPIGGYAADLYGFAGGCRFGSIDHEATKFEMTLRPKYK